jgi:hypothetical protein
MFHCITVAAFQIDDIEMDIDSVEQTTTPILVKEKTFIERYFQPSFKEKYQGPQYNYEDRKKNALERWLESDTNKEPKPSSPLWPLVFKIIIIAALAYGVYIIIGLILGKKGNWLFNKKSENSTLQYGVEDDNVVDGDFNTQIKLALNNGDFRLAIRYQYLNTLQKLDQKGVIAYHKEKTNADYGYEIKNSALAEAFRYISYIYDHAWYGGFDVTADTYRMASLAYDETNKMI